MNRDWLQRRQALRLQENGGKPIESRRSLSNWAQITQASITLCTVLLAAYAFASWTGQEAAKRKADVAMELVRNATAAKRCFEHSLYHVPPIRATLDREVVAIGAKFGETAVSQCKDAFSTLSADMFIAENVLDRETYLAASDLFYFITAHANRYSIILALLRDDALSSVDVSSSVREILESLGAQRYRYIEGADGVRREVLEEPIKALDGKMNVKLELDKLSGQLQKRLGAYIRFEGSILHSILTGSATTRH